MKKSNGDVIQFVKRKDYVMVNNNLGSGSFGKTVLLQDPFIDVLFVAKKYEPEFEGIREQFYHKFLDEIKILHKLNHRNVVRVYNYYAYPEIFTGYIVMEYIDGENLEDFISEYCIFSRVSIDNVFIQLIEGFRYIETNGIVHRDIREGNILLDRNGVVKIIDFGIGKLFEKREETEDSLVSEINRANSDTLPQEFFDGTYTSQTDMFYLAELFNRLILAKEDPTDADFSFQKVLDKMMQKRPEDRYNSFTEVKEALNKLDFDTEISEEDKKIYQTFSNSIYKSLSCFLEERKFNHDTSRLIEKLEKVLKDNCFEHIVQENSEIIECIVSGRFKYMPNEAISCADVYKFLNWFKGSTSQSQQLIISNLISKLSRIRVEIEEDYDLPF